MPELFTFLIKINIALVLFCVGYYLVLRKLTFYTLNRAYLVTAIVFSSVYPFVDLSVFAQRHQDIVAPVQNVVIYWKAPAENFVKQAAYWDWLEVLFWAGAAVFAARLLFQLISLYKIYNKSTRQEINGQAVRVVNGDISPFTFWQSIYINPEKLNPADLQNILEHEQIHVKEWHTLDVLLTEISVIFYWFNPGIWLIKKAVRENIEFITDRKILQKGLDSKAYQYSLLNITFNQSAPAITSNFNFSTLKKRIQMMNAKRSSKINLTRYAFLVPVVVVCLFTFSLSKAEVVKTNPAFKAIAAVVENINGIVLNEDTTTAAQSVTSKAVTTDTTIKAGNFKIVPIFSIHDDSSGIKRIDYKFSISAVNRDTGINDKVKLRSDKLNDSIVTVLNGKIFQNSIINNIDLNNIESVSVIKDATADFLKKIAGPNAPTNAKSVIYITTKAEVSVTSTLKPGANAVNVVGYGNKLLQQVDTTGPASTRIRLREQQSGQNSPLILIDGKESSVEGIDQDEIENITILKSGAAAVYGSKAKYGVILITTRKK